MELRFSKDNYVDIYTNLLFQGFHTSSRNAAKLPTGLHVYEPALSGNTVEIFLAQIVESIRFGLLEAVACHTWRTDRTNSGDLPPTFFFYYSPTPSSR